MAENKIKPKQLDRGYVTLTENQTISSRKTFEDVTITNFFKIEGSGALILMDPTDSLPYINASQSGFKINAEGNPQWFNSSGGSNNLILDYTNFTALRTVIFPDKTGTVAFLDDVGGTGSFDSSSLVTLDTTQTITGQKQFTEVFISGSININNTDGIGGNVLFPSINGGRNNNNLVTRLFQHDGKLGYKSPNNVTGSVQFDNNNTDHRTYTFPDKDGIVATLSDIQAVQSGSLSDGDYGDITVSGTGSIWSIDNGYVDLSTNQSVGGEKIFTGTFQTFDNRVSIGNPAFGGTRLGDSEFQSANIDTTAINFKSGSQETIAAMFLNPTGTVFTIKGFDDSIMVTDLTSKAAISGSEAAESTIANTIEYTNGEIYINDQGVQIYPLASTPVANNFFQVLQNRGGAPRLEFFKGFYDGTTYDGIYTIDISGSYNFNHPTRGPEPTGSSDYTTKAYVDANSGGTGSLSTYEFVSTYKEIVAGTKDGVNTTYTVAQGSYNLGSLTVYINGIATYVGDGLTETTAGSGIFDLTTAPLSTDIIYAEYQTGAGVTDADSQNRILNENKILDVTYAVNHTLTTEDIEISSGANIGKQVHLGATGSDDIDFTLPNIGESGQILWFETRSTGSTLEVIPDTGVSIVNLISPNDSIRLTGGYKEATLKKTAANQFRVYGTYIAFESIILNPNLITAVNAANPENEANTFTDWTTNDAAITIGTSATANNGSFSLSFTQTATGVNGDVQIQTGFVGTGTYAAGNYTLEFDVLVPVGANNVQVNFSNGNNGDVLNSANRSFDGSAVWQTVNIPITLNGTEDMYFYVRTSTDIDNFTAIGSFEVLLDNLSFRLQ